MIHIDWVWLETGPLAMYADAGSRGVDLSVRQQPELSPEGAAD
ncbi:hypothetical protein [Pseudomonas sp. MWU12-2323]|nr:hypothetical protein [Pseudomonas sp. MWU12-2323]